MMTAKQWGMGAAKALLVGTMAAGLCVGMTAGAFAQDEEDEEEILSPRPFRVHVTGGFLSDNSVREVLGSPILGGGLSYDVKEIDNGRPINIAATLDYFGKSRTKDRRNVKASYFAVGVAPRLYFLPDGTNLNFYAGAGAFLNFLSYKVTIAGTEETKDNTVTIGGRIFGGLEFNRSFFGEVEYIIPGKSALNAFNVSLGYRF